MLQALLVLWIVCALLILFAQRAYRLVLYFGVFSLITSAAYLFLGAPDVAMAEAGISAFATIFFIICIERYHASRRGAQRTPITARAEPEERPRSVRPTIHIVAALLFTAGLFALFVYFVPTGPASTYLKDQYLSMFMADVGGQNAVTAIYLGYRVYDTLFEALILVVSVVAVAHMSWYSGETVSDGQHSEIENSGMAIFTMRIICPLILIFGVYLIMNGHVSAGGGFQGGLAVASFFICRYMIYNVYDIPVQRVMKMEELVFISIIVVAALAVFLGATAFVYIPQAVYLVAMNVLIGLKVTCGFFILFYRHITIERLPGR